MPEGIESNHKRPCCRLLRNLSQSLDSLKNPNAAQEALDVLSKHCVLMKLMGQSAVKWDLSKSDCYLAVSPDDAQMCINEIAKTAAVEASLDQYAAILNHISGILANNAKLKQLSDRMQVFLANLRERAKKFGRVPDTSLLKPDSDANALDASDILKAHPYMKSPQMDGMSDDAADPRQNKTAAENVEALRNQLQYQPSPRPSPTPTKLKRN